MFRAIFLLLCAQLVAVSQEKQSALNPHVTVPFVGCPSDGQAGPVEAPRSTSISVMVNAGAAKQLAYYRSAQGAGVLAPRGWVCFGTYGSGGDALYVSPRAISFGSVPGAVSRPVIVLTRRFGNTSGRFGVAEIIARVFPSRLAFVDQVAKDLDRADSFQHGPFAKDKLTYKTELLVEYITPPETEGLGTFGSVKPDNLPIYGAAILAGQTPDLLLLSIRLPQTLAALAPAIVRQLESDSESIH